MKVLAFSDLHLDDHAADVLLEEAGEADLILGAGDFAVRRTGLAPFMARLAPLAGRAIYVPGNNESEAELRAATSATVLHGQVVERNGLRIAGIGAAIPPLPPGLPWDSFDLSEEQAEVMLGDIEGCDVLVSHSPPEGVADGHAQLGSLGSRAVRAAVDRLQPQLLICGHIHDSWGVEGTIGRTRVVNLGPGPNWFQF